MTDDARALWAAVVHQALLDTAGVRHRTGPVGRCSAIQDRALETAARRADAWIRTGGKDYRLVCAYAGVDADALRDRYIAGRIDMHAVRYLYGSSGKGAG